MTVSVKGWEQSQVCSGPSQCPNSVLLPLSSCVDTDAKGWRGITITDVTESPGVRIAHPYFFITRLCHQHIQRAGAGRHQNWELGRRLDNAKMRDQRDTKAPGKEVFVLPLVHGGLFGFMGRGWGFDGPAEEEWKTEGWLRWQASRSTEGATEKRKMGQAIRAWSSPLWPDQESKANPRRPSGTETS